MAEYWNITENAQVNFEKFKKEKPEPEMSITYKVGHKDFVNSGKASSEIKLMLKRLGVNPEILRRVAVASYEAEINVTAHSIGGNIICDIYLDCVHIKFKDNGPGIKSLEKALEPGWSTADDLVREMGFGAGLGLPNIKKNSDIMHIDSEESKSTLLEIIIFY
ncbi:MAG TPA: ATP-binding protein [Candidatus Cloacimonadota bacterium]|nr:ATP-binding protein [Candidatus Cloacimonadota bacterium]HOQ79852.1 ATP-binding protein [Candidatus Cloacimonadota bacterium]HPK41198.1 ATP-binding protein [Candidatus Cloacimonadota bacterium]